MNMEKNGNCSKKASTEEPKTKSKTGSMAGSNAYKLKKLSLLLSTHETLFFTLYSALITHKIS